MPAKKPYHKETHNQKDTSRNDSLNVSNIISSLVEANKGKLVTNARFGGNPAKK